MFAIYSCCLEDSIFPFKEKVTIETIFWKCYFSQYPLKKISDPKSFRVSILCAIFVYFCLVFLYSTSYIVFIEKQLLIICIYFIFSLKSVKFITSNLYLFIPVPGGGASSKRRHSFQSGVPGLTKEMDRLKVSHTAAEGGGHHSRGVSPRGSTRRRASAARRTSRGKRAPVFFFTRIHDNDITIY